jgi:mycothiol synthase
LIEGRAARIMVAMTGIEIRAYAPGDAHALAAVRHAVNEADRTSQMRGPDLQPSEPSAGALVAIVGGDIVGFTHANNWDEHDGTALYLLLGWVHPQFRRRGVGDALIDAQESAVRGALREHGRPVFGVNVTSPAGKAFVERHGYAYAFAMVDQTANLDAPPETIPFPAGVEERPVTADQHIAIFETIAECFDEHAHGYITVTWDEYDEDCLNEDTGLWSVAWDGDRIAGLVISTVDSDGIAETPWVAVRKGWRRRGLAQAMLRSSQQKLYARGVRTAVIRTTQENKDRTVELYQKLGYRFTARHPRYRKPA